MKFTSTMLTIIDILGHVLWNSKYYFYIENLFISFGMISIFSQSISGFPYSYFSWIQFILCYLIFFFSFLTFLLSQVMESSGRRPFLSYSCILYFLFSVIRWHFRGSRWVKKESEGFVLSSASFRRLFPDCNNSTDFMCCLLFSVW